MSKEFENLEKTDLIQTNNINVENSQNKRSNKRRRKELIDFDNEEEKNIKDENINELNTDKNEKVKEKNIIEIKKSIDVNDSNNSNNSNKFKTLDKCQNSHSPFRNNLVLQEKLKKIFLNREKIKFQYTKQEIPDYLKYHSDDSDTSENIELRKNENNNKKESNLISNISDKKYIENKKEKIKTDGQKTNIENEKHLNEENNNEIKSEKKLEEINEELKIDLTKNYNEDINQKNKKNNNIIENNNIKNEELTKSDNNIESKEIISDLSPEKVYNISKDSLNQEKENDETLKDDFKNIKNEEDIKQSKQESKNEGDLNIQNYKEKENNIRPRNKLTINVNKSINQKERTKDLFDILGKLKKNQAESVTNKKIKKKLDIINFPKEEARNTSKNFNKKNLIKNAEPKKEAQIKNKNINNNNLNIFLTNKESQKINQIQTIDLSYKASPKEINISYSSKGIPHVKYDPNKIPKIFNTNKNNIIPTRKTSELNRYKNTPNENSIDIDLNTTPSSHLDRSYDAINNNYISKENKSINVYRPKKINKNTFGKSRTKIENKMNKIIPNQNIIYNNFNNFF